MKNKQSKNGLSRLYVAFVLLALPFLQQCTQDKNLIVEPERPATGTNVVFDPTDTNIAAIKLMASAPYIAANGKDTVVLSPMAYNKKGNPIDTTGFELFHNDRKIRVQDFATTEAGKHAFVARLGQISSDTLTVEALQDSDVQAVIERIEITASTQVIIANGKSMAAIEVACYDGSGKRINHADGWTLYANGRPLEGSEFTTNTHGDQRIVARVGQIASNEVLISARQDKQYDIVTIPVVFHVGHTGEAIGTGANLSAATIQGLLDDLNRGYANGFGSTNPNAVDMRVRFRLAQTDESGRPLSEKGVIRTNITAYDNGKGNNTAFNRELGLTEWRVWQEDSYLDPKSYYNIWVYPAEENWAGLANYPSISANHPLSGISSVDPSRFAHYLDTDYNFPSPRINSKHRAGMNATVIHEIAHTLGLRHTFSENNCASADYCDDTYSYNYPHTDQPCPDNKAPMVANENFMDYRGSRNTFTYDQRERVRHTIKHGLWFAELVKSGK